jgi:hypothetical protein
VHSVEILNVNGGFFFTFMLACIVTNFLITKLTRFTNFSNLFWKWNSTCFGERNCPKHVEFHFQNKIKFEKLVRPVGFIIRNVNEGCTQLPFRFLKD